MSKSRPALVASLCVCASAWFGGPSVAHAATFDATGSFVADPNAVFALGFDAVTPEQVGLSLGTEPGALEGTGYAVLDSQDAYFEQPLPADLPPATYTLRFYARHNRVVGGVTVGYSTTEADHGDPSFYATAYPTGVVTSDGWYEVATAPFSIDPTRGFSASVFLFASGADLDGLELVREAAPPVAVKACTKAYDTACSANEFCASGFCRDGNVTVPGVPTETGGAGILASYIESRLELFFGGKLTRENRLPIASAVLASLGSAQSRWEVWNGISTALHRLRDWHTSMSGPTDFEGRGAFPLCFVEGEADASQPAGASDASLPDLLVSHGSPDPVASSNLGPGDRIVAIDGLHPVAWMDSLDAIDWGYWHANDPDVHAEAAERLRNAVRRFASEISIVRCDRTAQTCSATPETLLVKDLPADDEETVYPNCDHRPGYLIPGPDPVSHRVRGNQVGTVTGTTEEEAIRAMVWNGVYADGQTNPFEAALGTLTTGAKGVILDHRTGNGGTEIAAELLTQPFRAPALLGASTSFNLTLGLFDEPFDGLSLFDSRKTSPDDGYYVGSEGFNPNLKTALLLARDGSASDWFPLGMKAASPNVRIFGRTTAGAFSSFFQFDYYGNLAWQIASGDYVEQTGQTRIGRGVEPDEILLPKQSDLLQGKDTVALRALAWIRETP